MPPSIPIFRSEINALRGICGGVIVARDFTEIASNRDPRSASNLDLSLPKTQSAGDSQGFQESRDYPVGSSSDSQAPRESLADGINGRDMPKTVQ